MDKQTKDALKESIKIWKQKYKAVKSGDPERIKDLNWGAAFCPLCDVFNSGYCCDGCPVLNKTKKILCGGSPYTMAIRMMDQYQIYVVAGRPISEEFHAEAVAAVKDEYEFLKSLKEK